MNARTSSGIAAIWREGEVRETSVIPRAAQLHLHTLGEVTLHALAEGLLTSKNFPPAEWRKPQENYLDQCRVAWVLGELAQQHDGLHALVLRDATFSEFCDVQIGLQTGMEIANQAGRQALGITDPENQRLLERSRMVCTGRLYIPIGSYDDLTGPGMQLLLEEPAPRILDIPAQTTAPAAA
jgi:hypothetical protein